jgi:hypothetical protein
MAITVSQTADYTRLSLESQEMHELRTLIVESLNASRY